MYLSGAQIGIQTAHVVAELFRKYDYPENIALTNWASEYKTIICLNGGDNISMMNNLLMFEKMNYPVVPFFESGLGDVLTAYGVILPEEIYEKASEIRKAKTEGQIAKIALLKNNISNDKLKIIDCINTCTLAR
jgi:hypothetical protein